MPNYSSILILATTLLLLSCKHEPPETIPPPVGKLTEDFFLQGDYILRYSFLVNDGMYTHLPSDSMYLRIGPVVNGISLIQWVQGNTVLEEEAVAEMNIDEAYQNAYLWPYPPRTQIRLFDINDSLTVLMYCWPNYINYGYTTDSLEYSGQAFGAVGGWFFWKE